MCVSKYYSLCKKNPPDTPIYRFVFSILQILSRFKAFIDSLTFMTSQPKSSCLIVHSCWNWSIYVCPCYYNVTQYNENQRRHYDTRGHTCFFMQWPAQNNHMAGKRRGRWRALHVKMGRDMSVGTRDIYPFLDPIKTAFQTKVRRNYMHVQMYYHRRNPIYAHFWPHKKVRSYVI